MAKGVLWEPWELELLRASRYARTRDLMERLPGRTMPAIREARRRIWEVAGEHRGDEPLVRAPGDYLETLSAYLLDDWECTRIWMKWNGYAGYRELTRDMSSVFGWVTVLCTAKGLSVWWVTAFFICMGLGGVLSLLAAFVFAFREWARSCTKVHRRP